MSMFERSGDRRGPSSVLVRVATVLAAVEAAVAVGRPAGAVPVASSSSVLVGSSPAASGGCSKVLPVGARVVGMARTSDGGGYWLVDQLGGVAALGDAAFHGSAAGLRLTAPIVGMTATPDGKGYWLVGADGGVFSFGDAAFHGSGNDKLASAATAITGSAGASGYRLATATGGVYDYGTAGFHGAALLTGACQGAQPGEPGVDATAGQSSGAAGGLETVVFHLVNPSSTPCTVQGYPGFQLFDAAGRPIPIHLADQGPAHPWWALPRPRGHQRRGHASPRTAPGGRHPCALAAAPSAVHPHRVSRSSGRRHHGELLTPGTGQASVQTALHLTTTPCPGSVLQHLTESPAGRCAGRMAHEEPSG
ncbi:MAG: DUF4232 domain-containing protein [Acidimicrobiales bacterium]